MVGAFNKEETSKLDKAVARLQQLVGPLDGWRLVYLRELVQEMPEQAQSFKNARTPARPSELARKFQRFRRDPERLVRDLAGPGVTRSDAWQKIQANAVYARFLYFYARIVWSDQGDRHLGEEGDALDHLRSSSEPIENVVAATDLALRQLERQRPRGRGGTRRSRDSALQLACEHILNIYVTITDKAPSFSVLTREKNPEVQIMGPAVEFLRICLSIMGLPATRPTMRRCIEAHRAAMRKKGDSRLLGSPLPFSRL